MKNKKIKEIKNLIEIDTLDGIDTIIYKTDDLSDEIELIRTNLNEITETIDRLFKCIEATYTSMYMVNKEIKDDIYRITDELYNLKKEIKETTQ